VQHVSDLLDCECLQVCESPPYIAHEVRLSRERGCPNITVIYHNAVKLSGGWGVDADFGRPVVAGGGVGFSFYEVVVVAAAFDDAGAGAVAAGRVGSLEDLGDGLSGRAVQAGGGKRPPGR
jgi:hypothetical protein